MADQVLTLCWWRLFQLRLELPILGHDFMGLTLKKLMFHHQLQLQFQLSVNLSVKTRKFSVNFFVGKQLQFNWGLILSRQFIIVRLASRDFVIGCDHTRHRLRCQLTLYPVRHSYCNGFGNPEPYVVLEVFLVDIWRVLDSLDQFDSDRVAEYL